MSDLEKKKLSVIVGGALLVLLLLANQYVIKSFQYASCIIGNLTQSPPVSNLTHLDNVILNLYGNTVQNISPISLNSIFEFGGNGTNLQRENAENAIKGKVVVWKLKVYEIRRNKDGTFRIQTETGDVDRRSDAQKVVQGFLDIGNIFSGRGAVFTDRYENQNIGTFINLTLRHGGDVEYLSTLQTGSWIVIRGKITGVSLRNVDISPAVLEHKDNGLLYSQAYEKRFEFDKKMDEYKNRSCSHIWEKPAKIPSSVAGEALAIEKLDLSKLIPDSNGKKLKYFTNNGDRCTYESSGNKYKLGLGVMEIVNVGPFEKHLYLNGSKKDITVNDICPAIMKADDGYEYVIFYAGDGGNACEGPYVIMASNDSDYKFYKIETCYGQENLFKHKTLAFNGMSVKFTPKDLGRLR